MSECMCFSGSFTRYCNRQKYLWPSHSPSIHSHRVDVHVILFHAFSLSLSLVTRSLLHSYKRTRCVDMTLGCDDKWTKIKHTATTLISSEAFCSPNALSNPPLTNTHTQRERKKGKKTCHLVMWYTTHCIAWLEHKMTLKCFIIHILLVIEDWRNQMILIVVFTWTDWTTDNQ